MNSAGHYSVREFFEAFFDAARLVVGREFAPLSDATCEVQRKAIWTNYEMASTPYLLNLPCISKYRNPQALAETWFRHLDNSGFRFPPTPLMMQPGQLNPAGSSGFVASYVFMSLLGALGSGNQHGYLPGFAHSGLLVDLQTIPAVLKRMDREQTDDAGEERAGEEGSTPQQTTVLPKKITLQLKRALVYSLVDTEALIKALEQKPTEESRTGVYL